MKKSNKPVNLDEKALEKLKRASVENPGLVKFAHNLSSGKIVPLEEGAIRAHSFTAMHEQIDIQMEGIIEQIKVLAKQVENLQERKRVSEIIYNSKMTFEPVVGHFYYLYRKEDSEVFLSMIAPHEWGAKKVLFTYIAKVKLLADRTWKILDSTDEQLKTDFSSQDIEE